MPLLACLPVKAMYNCTCGFGQLLSILLPFLVAASPKSPSKVYGDFVNSFPCCLPFIYGCHYSVLLVEAKYMWIWPNLCHLWLPLGYLVLPVEAKYNGQRGCGDFWLHNQQLPFLKIVKITIQGSRNCWRDLWPKIFVIITGGRGIEGTQHNCARELWPWDAAFSPLESFISHPLLCFAVSCSGALIIPLPFISHHLLCLLAPSGALVVI